MSKIKCMFIFSIGAAVGSFATYKLVKTKYERLAQEEIDDVREYYRNKKEKSEETIETEPVIDDQLDDEEDVKTKEEYGKVLIKEGYGAGEFKKESSEDMRREKPYVISPDDFGERDYKIVSLTYYADKVLADDADMIVEDVEDIVGLNSLDSFGEYEDDSVFVRNESLETDYEILLDMRNYSDIYPGNKG